MITIAVAIASISDQVKIALNRSALIVIVRVAVGALMLGLVVGLL